MYLIFIYTYVYTGCPTKNFLISILNNSETEIDRRRKQVLCKSETEVTKLVTKFFFRWRCSHWRIPYKMYSELCVQFSYRIKWSVRETITTERLWSRFLFVMWLQQLFTVYFSDSVLRLQSTAPSIEKNCN